MFLEYRFKSWKTTCIQYIMSNLDKLTYLVCVLLPDTTNEQELISCFQKCTNLQAIEANFCSTCSRNNYHYLLSYFLYLLH